MKRILKKNQIIITTLAVMVAVAGYLNYSGRILEEEADQANADDSAVLLTEEDSPGGTDSYTEIASLDGEGTDEEASPESEAQVGEAVLASASAGDNLAAAARLKRQTPVKQAYVTNVHNVRRK